MIEFLRQGESLYYAWESALFHSARERELNGGGYNALEGGGKARKSTRRKMSRGKRMLFPLGRSLRGPEHAGRTKK